MGGSTSFTLSKVSGWEGSRVSVVQSIALNVGFLLLLWTWGEAEGEHQCLCCSTWKHSLGLQTGSFGPWGQVQSNVGDRQNFGQLSCPFCKHLMTPSYLLCSHSCSWVFGYSWSILALLSVPFKPWTFCRHYGTVAVLFPCNGLKFIFKRTDLSGSACTSAACAREFMAVCSPGINRAFPAFISSVGLYKGDPRSSLFLTQCKPHALYSLGWGERNVSPH